LYKEKRGRSPPVGGGRGEKKFELGAEGGGRRKGVGKERGWVRKNAGGRNPFRKRLAAQMGRGGDAKLRSPNGEQCGIKEGTSCAKSTPAIISQPEQTREVVREKAITKYNGRGNKV